uniref:S haplotype-specific F-box protein 1 n=1 Tax=Prunus dulcis TaxID=3755 RepID=Q84KK0_PRUDU|nr:S haplotype-specific F-box protein 1 [Prunus dulcis]QDB64831.1 S haplotype-specific F-box protein 1 [Prunus dulcis]BAC65207.1 S haplotype-specific F-box protein b [Prunus dulcis]
MTFTLRKKETLIDILVRLPAKSLVRFLCTCKSWMDLIGSSSFVSTHLHRNVTKHAHVSLLCLHHQSFECQVDPDDPYVGQELQWSLFCDETFVLCSKLSHPLGSTEQYYGIYGSSNGLVCISDEILNFDSPIYIWNPSVRKLRTPPLSTNINIKFSHVALQFGFHPGVNDYKTVRMMRTNKSALAVEVYSLRTDCWKMIEAIPPWLKCTWRHHKGTFLNGVAYHIIEKGPIFSIMSFNAGTEEFQEFIAPDAVCSLWELRIDVYKENICLLLDLYPSEEDGMEKIDLWVLQEKRWKQLCPFIYPSDHYYRTIGMSMDNKLLMPRRDYTSGIADLHLCDYESKQVLETGIKLAVMKYGEIEFLFSISYIESLVLLNNY